MRPALLLRQSHMWALQKLSLRNADADILNLKHDFNSIFERVIYDNQVRLIFVARMVQHMTINECNTSQ